MTSHLSQPVLPTDCARAADLVPRTSSSGCCRAAMWQRPRLTSGGLALYSQKVVRVIREVLALASVSCCADSARHQKGYDMVDAR